MNIICAGRKLIDMLAGGKKSCRLFFVYSSMGCEGDPLSPPEEEATPGEHPLDPASEHFPFSGNFLSTFLKASHLWEFPAADE